MQPYNLPFVKKEACLFSYCSLQLLAVADAAAEVKSLKTLEDSQRGYGCASKFPSGCWLGGLDGDPLKKKGRGKCSPILTVSFLASAVPEY